MELIIGGILISIIALIICLIAARYIDEWNSNSFFWDFVFFIAFVGLVVGIVMTAGGWGKYTEAETLYQTELIENKN